MHDVIDYVMVGDLIMRVCQASQDCSDRTVILLHLIYICEPLLINIIQTNSTCLMVAAEGYVTSGKENNLECIVTKHHHSKDSHSIGLKYERNGSEG